MTSPTTARWTRCSAALADFDGMLQKAHGLGLKVIVDLVPNHTSDEHVVVPARPWPRSRARPSGTVTCSGPGRTKWRVPATETSRRTTGSPSSAAPPGRGPRMRTARPGDWYLHLFDTKQPDLNWENPEVREEMRSVHAVLAGPRRGRLPGGRGARHGQGGRAAGLGRRGGHGGRLSRRPAPPGCPRRPPGAVEPHTAHHSPCGRQRRRRSRRPGHILLLDATEGPQHQPVSPLYPPSPFFDQDGVHDVYRDWNRVLAEYDGDRMLVAEAWVEPAERLARYIRKDEMHQAFNFDFLLAGWNAGRMAVAIEESLEAAASVGAPSTWVLSNHDTVRHTEPVRPGGSHHASRRALRRRTSSRMPALGLARARAATLVSLALPGSAYVYQGEELGLPEHTTLPAEARQDPTFFRTNGIERGRDGCRVPLPWKSGRARLRIRRGLQCGVSSDGVPSDGRSGHRPPAAPWLPQPESFGELPRTGRKASGVPRWSCTARRCPCEGATAWVPVPSAGPTCTILNWASWPSRTGTSW